MCDATKADTCRKAGKVAQALKKNITTTDMSKNVLLLGGAGFIGFNIARYLAENRDYKLTIADNFARGKQDDYFTELVNKHNIRVVAGDFTDPVTFNQLDEAYDQVYMLASVVG
ncbi:MAG: NAD-dependent epimerase/dehydratase family protein, partial [Chitinophagaceae bacterium]